jgi:3-oxoacyl-[acyl-carrier protein] reductase
MDLGLRGKRAIVCAGSKGLGRGCAEALAANGVHLVLNARGAEALEATAAAIRAAHGVEVTTVATDVTTEAGRAQLLKACPDPDILVNNAGGPPPGDFRGFGEEAWLAAIRGNMLTPIELIRATVDGMAARGFGRIVNITSSSVRSPIPDLVLSNGARTGLTGFVAGVSRTVAGKGVTINNLLPGRFATDRLRSGMANRAKNSGKDIAEIEAQSMAQVPAGRFGDPAEFGQVCAFLCSVHAGYIVGQYVLVDGGLVPLTM